MTTDTSTRSCCFLFCFHSICAVILVLSTASLHAQTIGEVNGTKIDGAEFEARLSDAIQVRRDQSLDMEVDEQPIRDAVWERMIGEILIQQAADRMGIRVTDAELHRKLLYDPPDFLKSSFTDSTGTFQQSLYQSFMTDVEGFLTGQGMPADEIPKVKQQVAEIQESIRKDLLYRAVDSAVTLSAIPSPAEAFIEYKNQHSRATGSFAMLDADVIPDAQVNATNEETREYFEAHRDEFRPKVTAGHSGTDSVDVTEQVTAAVRTHKKLDMLKDRAEKLRAGLSPRDKLSKLTSVDKSVRIQQFKDLSPLSPFPGVGFDSLLVASAFSQTIGEISPAVRGARGYYFVQVKSRQVPTDREFASKRDEFIEQLTSQRRMVMFQEWFGKERERAKIKDYRAGGN